MFYSSFYCWIDLNEYLLQPFNCSMFYLAWISVSQFDILNCLVFVSLSPLWVSHIETMFCQCKTVAIVACSLLELRQCEQHCVCALRFRKWEFKMVIPHHLFEEEGIESNNSPLPCRQSFNGHMKRNPQTRTSSQCHSRDLYSSDQLIDATEDAYMVVMVALLLFQLAATKSSLW